MNAPRDLRLTRLHVAGYGRLQDYALEPTRAPGVLVVAPNEAGKSTLCSALYRGLFGFADKAQEEARRPWGGGPYAVTLEWALGPDVTCAIERDFETQRVAVEWRRIVPGSKEPVLERRWEGEPNPRGRSSDRMTYDAELRRLLGFASSEIFHQSAYVGPADTAVKPLASELLRLLSGSDRTDFKAALADLEANYYQLTQVDIGGTGRVAKHKARRLEELAAERAELVRRRGEALAVRDQRREAEDAVRRTRARIVEIEADLADRGRAEAAFRRLAELKREIADAERRKDELDARVGGFVEWERKVREKSAELEPYVRYLHFPTDFPERLGRVRALREERARVGAEATRVREALAVEPSAKPELAAAGAGGGLLGLVVVLVLLGLWPAAIGAGVAAAGCMALGAWLRRRRRVRRHALMAEWSRLQGDAVRLDREQRELAEQLPPGLEGEDSAPELERYERARQIRAELDGMQATRTTMGDRDALERERRAVKEERLDVLRLEQRKLVEAHPYLDWGPDYERQFGVEQGRLREELRRLEDEELAQRRVLADVRGGEDDPIRLEERIRELDREEDRLALDRDAYRLAFDTLTLCKDEFVKVMAQRLQRRMGRVFEAMTGGRYDAVEIDPLSLELTVHGIEKRGVPAESLSRGTRDQLYFALRVAILEELAADRALPIILDDPFLHFDRERLARVEETLSKLGESHQILLFTHDARLAGWGFPKQFLPAPATREEVPASGG